MVNSARDELKEYNHQFEFEVADACQTPFEDNQFQMILANHMLPLIENKDLVFSEINRLLSDNGFAYASTASARNFRELHDITNEFDKRIVFDHSSAFQSFSLENGENVLSSYFNVVNKYIYQNDVIIKNSEPLILYLASCFTGEQFDIYINKLDDFRSYLDSIIRKSAEIRITNERVLFKFRK
jgi:SAM-dependent methyltransferase